MRITTLVVLCLCLACATAWPADSPQFRGPNRDGVFPEKGLLQEWPAEGPPLVWTAQGVGQGYSAVSVVGNTVYVGGMLDDNQGYLFALDASSGAIKWKAAYGPETQDSQASGSRSTPTVDGDRIYLMSGLGVLSCLSAKDGSVVWQVDTMATFQGQAITWSIAESPLIDGGHVICTPGGPDASVVALDKMTGKTVWTSKGLSEPSAYCSPDLFDFGGRRVVVTMTAKSVVGIDAATGAVLWTHRHETDYDIHAVSPVRAGNRIYYTGGYGSGGGVLDVSADGATITPGWTDKNLDCQHHGVVVVDGAVYGTSHADGGKLKCLDMASGKLLWSTDEVTQGDVVYADGMLYVYEGPKKGVMSLVKASPAGYERTGFFEVARGRDKHWAHPTIANGRLYVRYGGSVYAYDIAAK